VYVRPERECGRAAVNPARPGVERSVMRSATEGVPEVNAGRAYRWALMAVGNVFGRAQRLITCGAQLFHGHRCLPLPRAENGHRLERETRMLQQG
jgi:hypothetical protein